MWVARDSNHKVRGVQKNRKGPLRRDRAREEELGRERERETDVKATCAQGLVSLLLQLSAVQLPSPQSQPGDV